MINKNFLKKLKSIFILLTGLAILGFYTGCEEDSDGFGNNPPGSAPPADEVWMVNNTFNPPVREVAFENQVTFRNKDEEVHKVVSGTPGNPDGFFQSGDIQPAGTFGVTFGPDTVVAGEYDYYCPYHSGMEGTLTIKNNVPK